MVRKYQSGNGKRRYAGYSEDELEEVVAAIKNGLSQCEASRRFKISRGDLAEPFGYKA